MATATGRLKALSRMMFFSLVCAIATFSLSSCTDEELLSNGMEENAGVGDMILFTVGTTNNAVTTRAVDEGGENGESNSAGEGSESLGEGSENAEAGPGTTVTPGKNYYMKSGSRFVCRMYYYARPGVEEIDVDGGTDYMAWLKVDGSIGNSLYWNRFYDDIEDKEGYGGHDNLGNDYNADAFYWQNRKPHVFLAMTDLNQATNPDYKYGIDQGKLKLTPADQTISIKTENKIDAWEPVGYTIEGISENFNSWDGVKKYVDDDEHGSEESFIQSQNACAIANNDWKKATYEYMYGWSCKYSTAYAEISEITTTSEEETIIQQIYGPIKYLMYYQTYPYEESVASLNPVYEMTEQGESTGKIISYKDDNGLFVCNVVYNDDVPSYVVCDEYGNTLYNEDNPKYTFYYYEIREKHSIIEEHKYNVNAYDLTRGDREDISEQPDICQAIRSQEPLGATQASNRVNLYFKHQFSQVQVNLKNAADNSVNITAGQLRKVELLGISEEAYVCIDLNKNGEINHEPIYKAVRASDYTEGHLAENPYGTSFDMFEMTDPTPGYLKSFNCITFGQLQAIRITWQELDSGISHTATFRVTETELQNLRSGYKYIWNMELRRGTLAVVRTEVDNWIVSQEKEDPNDTYTELEYGTSGTINN